VHDGQEHNTEQFAENVHLQAKSPSRDSFEKVLIVGVGKSGQSTARFLLKSAKQLGMKSLTLVDSAQSDSLDVFLEKLHRDTPTEMGLHAHFGVEQVPAAPTDLAKGAQDNGLNVTGTEEKSYDICIITPGLAPHTSLAKSAYAQSHEVVSELELAYRLSPAGLNWIAITGTNGKTTTTELVREVLSAKADVQVFSVGNIGTPALELLNRVRPGDYFVAEISSFQAARLGKFRPQVAALLNLSSDHLDWHKNIESYAADKCEIFANSRNDDLVLLPHEDCLHEQTQVLIASAARAAVKRGARVETISVDDYCLPADEKELNLKGKHNLTNACFATAIGRYCKVPDADIAQALKDFSPQPHRMQEIGTFEEVIYVNDSKSTNSDASISALSAYAGLELTLLLGGQGKGADYLDLAKAALARAQTILLFGQAAKELNSCFSALSTDIAEGQQILSFETMRDAVFFACKHADSQQVVMLSPANASFDEFDNYEQRGLYFKALVETFYSTVAAIDTPLSSSICQDLDAAGEI